MREKSQPAMSDSVFNREYRLSDLALFVNEKISSGKITPDTYISTENMLANAGDIEVAAKLPSVPKCSHFRSKDTLFSNIRTYFRKIWLAEFEGGASPDVLVIRTIDPEILDPHYLYFLLSNQDFINYTVITSRGTKMPRGDKTAMMQYRFFLPDMDRQKQTGKNLLNINNKIRLNRKTSQTLESMAQTLFKSWFLDFDPVLDNALAEGNPIPEELQEKATVRKAIREDVNQPKLPEHIKQLFPGEFEHNEGAGWIPKGWEIIPISNLADCVGGATPSTQNSDFWKTGTFTWVSPKDLSNAKTIHLMKTDKKITYAGLQKIPSGLLPVGTVLLSSRAPIGYLALTTEPTAINQGFIALKPKQGVSNLFLLHWLRHNMDEIKKRSSGTTFPEISKAVFRPIPAISPTKNIMSAYHDIVFSIYEQILACSKTIEILQKLRDTLLPELVSGSLPSLNPVQTD